MVVVVVIVLTLASHGVVNLVDPHRYLAKITTIYHPLKRIEK